MEQGSGLLKTGTQHVWNLSVLMEYKETDPEKLCQNWSVFIWKRNGFRQKVKIKQHIH